MTIIENMSGQIIIDQSVLQTLAARLHYPVSATSRERAALHLLDWLGVSVAGIAEPQARGFIAFANGLKSGNADHHAGLLSAATTHWWQVLNVNAAVGNMLEMDDLHRLSILHPGPVIIPAAIAVAETIGASGEALLTAIVRGYEATIRIGSALGTSHYQYFHNTSTCGAFGAAAAAASLLDLNADETTWALANAGSRTGGLWQMRHEACETKSLHNVMAAQTGVQAAMLAKHGVRGPAQLLEGTQGLFAAMTDGANADNVAADIDAPWRIHEVSMKPWPACRHAHPVIDAALAVKSSLANISASDIAKIEIQTYKSALDFCDKPAPTTVHEAKFSLQHCAAVVLVKGAPTLDDFALLSINNTALASMRARVTVVENSAMTEIFPHHYQAHITVTLNDQSTHNHMQHDAKGDPEYPMTTTEITNKARMLLAITGVENRDALVKATITIDSASTLTDWTAMWTAPSKKVSQHG